MGLRHSRFAGIVFFAFIVGITCPGIAQQSSTAKAKPAFENHPANKLMQRLEKRANVMFDEVPLAEAIDQLKSEYDLPLVFDRAAIDVEGLDVESAEVSLEQKNIKLGTALRLMLRPLSLTIEPNGPWLLVTTLEAAESKQTTVNYPVWDLVKPEVPGQGGADYDSLIAMITSAIAPEKWDEVGGPGTVIGQKGVLTVAQTVGVHQSVSRLIDALRSLPIAAEASKEELPNSVALGARQRGPKQLTAPAVLRFDSVELGEVAKLISSKYDVKLVLDEEAMDEVGYDAFHPVSCNLTGANLGQSLRMMLSELELTFVVRDDLIVITSAEEAEQQLATRVYPVAGLLDSVKPFEADYDTLIDNVTSTISPDSWEDVGGVGSISAFTNRACFVISQTSDVHEKIDAHLQDLFAKAEDSQVKRKEVVTAPEKIVTHVYKIPTKTEHAPEIDDQSRHATPKSVNAQMGGMGGGMGPTGGGGGMMGDGFGFGAPMGGFAQSEFAAQLKSVDTNSLLSLIELTIPNMNWSLPDARIVALPDRLYVRCRHDIHEKIQDLLDELSVTTLNPYGREPEYPSMMNMGGMMGGMGGGGMGGGGMGGGGMGGGGMFSVGDRK